MHHPNAHPPAERPRPGTTAWLERTATPILFHELDRVRTRDEPSVGSQWSQIVRTIARRLLAAQRGGPTQPGALTIIDGTNALHVLGSGPATAGAPGVWIRQLTDIPGQEPAQEPTWYYSVKPCGWSDALSGITAQPADMRQRRSPPARLFAQLLVRKPPHEPDVG